MKIHDLAYVLHRRPYRETSFLVDFFTQHHGVITAVCRGARKAGKKSALTLFTPFWIEYVERGSLATLYQFEPELNANIQAIAIDFSGMQLYCGLYLNELSIKLLGKHDPYPDFFIIYQETLNKLQASQSAQENVEKALRCFELNLLEAIGYGLSLETEASAHEFITPENLYYYRPNVGFSLMMNINTSSISSEYIFKGLSLMSIAKKDFSDIQVLKDAKRLIRITLDTLLEKHGKLKSRELFRK